MFDVVTDIVYTIFLEINSSLGLCDNNLSEIDIEIDSEHLELLNRLNGMSVEFDLQVDLNDISNVFHTNFDF